MNYKVGTGSWYLNVSYDEYRGVMTLDEYRKFCYDKCKERFLNLGLKKGDMIRITYVNGGKPRKYIGVIKGLSGYSIKLQQKNTERYIDVVRIDDVEVLEKMPKYS